MTHDFTIQNEKLNQVAGLLKQNEISAWLTFVRETSMSPDPALDLILGLDMTWHSAFLITQNDDRIAIVGRYDVDNVKRMGGFKEVIGYDADIFPELRTVLQRLDPELIAVNYSDSDVAADGLTHGLWRQLNTGLADTPFKHRFVSAERIIASLRGRKSETEQEKLRAAIRTTEKIIQAITDKLAPGMNEVQIYEFVQAQMKAAGVVPAWEGCPVVSVGPDSSFGHTLPDEKLVTQPGQLVHLDLGVVQDNYVSDLQRVWYLKKEGEDGLPEKVQTAFDAVRGAILAAAKVLKPGIMGWQVDEASRKYITQKGYPEYQHAVGHHIGRTVHDGATVLAPRWPRYGKTADGVVEAGNVFTLELGVHVPEYGFIGLEEDVLVKEDGLEWLSTAQVKITVVG